MTGGEVGGGVDAALLRLLRRDRWVALGLLAVVAAGSWAFTLAGGGMRAGGDMAGMEGIAGMADMAPPPRPLALFAMWWAMMVAMMLPAAAPMILVFAAVERRRQGRRPPVPTVLFAASYLIVWGGFSALAAWLQARAAAGGLIGPDMALDSRGAAGALMLAAGLYQRTPLKAACLARCRDPVRSSRSTGAPDRPGRCAWGCCMAHSASAAAPC